MRSKRRWIFTTANLCRQLSERSISFRFQHASELMTGRGKLRAATCVAAIFSFAVLAFGQHTEWSVVVNGVPVPLPRPAVSSGQDLSVPLFPITRVLGFQIEPGLQPNTFILRRGVGAPIEYDGQTGEIRYGPVVAGQLRNYKQVSLSGPLEELLFPVDGLITLLAVDVRLDTGERILYINSSSDPFNPPSAHRVGISDLDYTVGVTKAEDNEGHYTMLRSGALAGGIPIHSSLLVAGEGSGLQLQQATAIADLARRQRLTMGDQGATTGIDALATSLRGVGYNTAFGKFDALAYAGRTAGSVRQMVGSPGVGNYDTTTFGGALRKRSKGREFSYAANSFKGPEREGTSAGMAFVETTPKNQLRAQTVAGTFSGISSRTMTVSPSNAAFSLDPAIFPAQTTQRVRVQGGALGFSVVDTYKPLERLTFTGQLERYGKNFLTAREDSGFSAQSTQRVSSTLRPLSSISLYGGVTRQQYLAGDPVVMHGFDYGAVGAPPSWRWLQLGYFKAVQDTTAPIPSRLRMSQYSATLVNLLQYSGSVMLSDFQFNGVSSRTINATAGRDFFSYGHLILHDQLQFSTAHRYGAEWQLVVPHGSLRVGLDRWTDLRNADRAFIPLLGFAFTLPHKQRLVATYSGEKGAHTFSIVIGGPVVNREALRKDDNGRISVVAQASLEGRVYVDSNENNKWDAGSDVAMPGITVWLDEQTSTVTDATGLYRFDHLKSGTHAVKADLSEVPADMVFADSGERRIAVLPFKNNVQNFPIVRTGAASGKVTYIDDSDPDNPVRKPLPEARVIADSEHDTYSDADGNIIIGSLRPGAYELRVDAETVPDGYVATVTPRIIQVKAGETLRGVQIDLSIPPKPTITRDLPKQQSITAP
jgi:hypothetical protein